MSGAERALLYKLAIESGLRANELRTLKVSSFDFTNNTVTVEACYSKHRREDVLSLRPETAEELKAFCLGKLSGTHVFGGRYKQLTEHTSAMIQQDLAATEEKDAQGNVIRPAVAYVDSAGRYRDFHSLRHSTGSFLAAAGVHPKTIQQIMRHGDINLTMTRYTHCFRGQEADAIAKLPDLSAGNESQQLRATGTDDKPVDALVKNLAQLHAFPAILRAHRCRTGG